MDMPLAPFTNRQIAAEQVGEVQLAAGEDRAGRNAELVVASLALELAAGGDVVGTNAAATRANGFTVRWLPSA
jgi:hypothetical protein